ncbi:MAG: TonB-dependent receptor [Balneolales bacterium]|nr:TonB-dependent receptor [Balneolales bacterium]
MGDTSASVQQSNTYEAGFWHRIHHPARERKFFYKAAFSCDRLLLFVLLIFTFIGFLPGFYTTELSATAQGNAANDTTIVRADLDVITITAGRFGAALLRQPVHVSRIDSAALAQNGGSLGDVLSFGSPAMIRNYGPGGLQTVSARGFGSRQTPLLWNGFALNHSMLGDADLSLIPAAYASNVQVATGNAAAAYGYGGAGGNILFSSRVPENGIGFSHQNGSWGQQSLGFEAGVHSGSFRLGILADASRAQLNYPYFDPFRGREELRRNSQFERKSGMITAGYSYAPASLDYETSFWISDHSQHLPASITVRNPRAVQEDAWFRNSHRLRYIRSHILLEAAFFIENYRLDYTDTASRIESESEVRRRESRLSVQWNPAEAFLLVTGLDYANTKAITNNFREDVSRSRQAAFTHAEWTPLPGLTIIPSARGAILSDIENEWMLSAGISYLLPVDGFAVRAQLSRNASSPTLNDLYWSSGGNPDLRPESSFSREVGLSYAASPRRGIRVESGITFYASDFQDGIRWVPGRGGIWSPVNIAEIRSRGLELDFSAVVSFGDWTLRGGASVIRTRAEAPQIVNESEAPVWKQLVYVPEWQHKASFELARAPFSIRASVAYFGDRFTTADHSSPADPLSSFYTADLRAGLDLKPITGVRVQLSYATKNVTNQTYQFITQYPMPPRHHEIGIRLYFLTGSSR